MTITSWFFNQCKLDDNNNNHSKPNIGEKIKQQLSSENHNSNNTKPQQQEQPKNTFNIDYQPIYKANPNDPGVLFFKEYRSLEPNVKDYISNKYQLKFVQIITRHGRRTPESKNYPLSMWTCNSTDNLITNKDKDRPDCNMGQLTVWGVKDMVNVGNSYKHLFIDSLGFLDKVYNPNQIFVRSSNRERTISSARSFMHGLYGGSFSDEQEKEAPHHSSFFILPDKQENMYPRSNDRYIFLKGLVKKHKDVIKENKESGLAEFTAQIKDIFEKSKGFDSPFYVPAWRSYNGLVNSFDCFKNHDLPLPKGFTKEIIDRMYLESAKEFKAVKIYPELSILGIGRFVNDLEKQMELKAKNDPSVDQLKLSLYSAHDTTLAALLVAFDMYEELRHPVTSSALEFILFEKKQETSSAPPKTPEQEKQLIENQFVKVVYNHSVIHIGACKEKEVDDMCPLSEFIEISKKLIPSNYEEMGKITEEEKQKYIYEATH
ncbi:hypothetical protein CYY_004600 [Polysphondylium violaceum]|uniref:Histidine acid phosphatase family protein n=1 Tax=Polysphondylium violaceum TaxID=133409 RepID=A0A8J4USW3_9MYCE|nr:hypothetical protein CYY_004600 [Polysphondylium violaceum]